MSYRSWAVWFWIVSLSILVVKSVEALQRPAEWRFAQFAGSEGPSMWRYRSAVQKSGIFQR